MQATKEIFEAASSPDHVTITPLDMKPFPGVSFFQLKVFLPTTFVPADLMRHDGVSTVFPCTSLVQLEVPQLGSIGREAWKFPLKDGATVLLEGTLILRPGEFQVLQAIGCEIGQAELLPFIEDLFRDRALYAAFDQLHKELQERSSEAFRVLNAYPAQARAGLQEILKNAIDF